MEILKKWLNYCKNIDKSILQSGSSSAKHCLESKHFERRKLDEKVGSFLYFGFIGIGFVVLFYGAEVSRRWMWATRRRWKETRISLFFTEFIWMAGGFPRLLNVLYFSSWCFFYILFHLPSAKITPFFSNTLTAHVQGMLEYSLIYNK